MEEAIKIVENKLASITQENNYFAMGARSALQEVLVQLQAAQQSAHLTGCTVAPVEDARKSELVAPADTVLTASK